MAHHVVSIDSAMVRISSHYHARCHVSCPRFFPIFFKEEVGLAPTGVTLVWCAVPLVLSLFSFLSQREALVTGRVTAIVINR